MNQRFQELKQQAAREVANSATWHLSTDEEWNDALSAKFAELIVQETLNVALYGDEHAQARDNVKTLFGSK